MAGAFLSNFGFEILSLNVCVCDVEVKKLSEQLSPALLMK